MNAKLTEREPNIGGYRTIGSSCVVQTSGNKDDTLAQRWPNAGPTLVQHWSNTGPTPAQRWPKAWESVCDWLFVYISISKVTLSVVQLPALTEVESLSCVFGLLPPQPAIVMGTSITCQSPVPELLPPMLTGSGESATVMLFRTVVSQDLILRFSDFLYLWLSTSRSHDPARVTGIWPCDHHHGQDDIPRLWSCEPTEPELPVRHSDT